MEKINKKVILIAILFAVVATLLIYLYLTRAGSDEETVQYQKIIVAAVDLPKYHEITDTDLKQLDVPSGSANLASLNDMQDIIGKIVSEQIYEGEQILAERLVDVERNTLSYLLPEGKRAISFNIDEQIAVAGLLRPGDSVDVIASFEQEEYELNGIKVLNFRVTKTIIQNAVVLAISQDTVLPEEKLKELGKTLTLALKPADIEKLVYATEFGMVRLALRCFGDESVDITHGITRKSLVP